MGKWAVLLASGVRRKKSGGTPARKNFDKGRHRRLQSRIAARPARCGTVYPTRCILSAQFPAELALVHRSPYTELPADITGQSASMRIGNIRHFAARDCECLRPS